MERLIPSTSPLIKDQYSRPSNNGPQVAEGGYWYLPSAYRMDNFTCYGQEVNPLVLLSVSPLYSASTVRVAGAGTPPVSDEL